MNSYADQTELSKHVVNNILKELFYKILRIQENAIKTYSQGNVTITEVHILEAVEETRPATMGSIAKKLGIKTPSLTVTVKKLVNKALVERLRPEDDQRKVFLMLTKKGKEYYLKHKKFHKDMVNAVVKDFKMAEMPILIQSMKSLNDFFEEKYKEFI